MRLPSLFTGTTARVVALAAVAAAAVATAALVGGPATGPAARVPAASRSAAPHGLTPDQRRRADELISVFENSTTDIRYDYADNLGDGRGVTAGRAGFTTADGDALEVVRRYTEEAPGNPLARFVPTLRRLAGAGSDDTGALPEGAYVAAWHASAADPRFRRVQDRVCDRLYFEPAMRLADRTGLRTALARAEVYDAIVQHGGGEDPDGLPALIRRARAAAGGDPAHGVDERRWLGAFLARRLADLRHPANESTRREWSESADRVNAVRRIAATGDYDLSGPITVTVFGDRFTIE